MFITSKLFTLLVSLVVIVLGIFVTVSHAESASTKTVVMVGGGVGGLSAAMELAERGFKVKIFERQPFFGGKARSIDVPGSAAGGRLPFPGEHGFRFFPGFYAHMNDTMRRIPYGNNKNGVLDNLVHSNYDMLARQDAEPWIFPTHKPYNRKEFLRDLEYLFEFRKIKIPIPESLYFIQRVALMVCTCDERWDTEYDKISYWDYMHASELSPQYGKYLVKGVTRNIVAAKADIASLKTIGRTFIRLIESTRRSHLDRVLNGPTNDTWIEPMVRHLKSMGVEFYPSMTATGFDFDGNEITAVNFLNGNDQAEKISGDYYVSAVPLERFKPFVTPAMAQKAPSLSQLSYNRLEWMNGIQFYFRHNISIIRGHIGFFDSPWALTSVSQQQFWPNTDVSKLGDGSAVDILSVDVSDWNVPGLPDGPSKGLSAKECSREQIVAEVWYQMHRHLPQYIPANMSSVVSHWFMDPDIIFDNSGAGQRVKDNEEPLLINIVGSWPTRPEATTEIKNLFLASEYIKTTTDVASMEAANEAGRRAVNGILTAEQRTDFVHLFAQYWPEHYNIEKKLDCHRFHKGQEPLGWNFPVPKYHGDMEQSKLEYSSLLEHLNNYQKELKLATEMFLKEQKHKN